MILPNINIETTEKGQNINSSIEGLFPRKPPITTTLVPQNRKKKLAQNLSQKSKTVMLKKCVLSKMAQKNEMSRVFKSANSQTFIATSDNIKMKIKMINIIIGFMAILSILLIISDNEVYSRKTHRYWNEFAKANDVPYSHRIFKEIKNRSLSNTENNLRIGNICVSCCIIVLLIVRYFLLLKLTSLSTSFNRITLVGLVYRIVIASVIYPPCVNVIFINDTENSKWYQLHTLNSIWAGCSLVKWLLCKQWILIWTKFNSDYTKSIFRTYLIKFTMTQYIKYNFYTYPLMFICLSLIPTMFILAYLIQFFEFLSIDKNRGYLGNKGINDLRSLMNSCWLVFSTMFSVGYGDNYPRSFIGRIVIIFASLFGIGILGWFLIFASGLFRWSTQENKAYSKLKKLNDIDNYETKAGWVILSCVLIRKYQQQETTKSKTKVVSAKNKTKKLKEIFVLKVIHSTYITNFNNPDYISSRFSMPISNILTKMSSQLNENIDSLTTTFNELNNISQDLTLIITTEKDIQQKLREISQCHQSIHTFLMHNFNQMYFSRIRKHRGSRWKYSSILKANHLDIPGLDLKKHTLKNKKTLKNWCIPSPTKKKSGKTLKSCENYKFHQKV